MLDVFIKSWKIKEIRNRLIYVLIIIAIYRLGSHIALPGINPQEIAKTGDQSLFAMIAGGGMGTIFFMGIGPYITSSIIMQLLTVAIPRLEQIQKEGEEGRKKIAQYTRVVAVGLSFLQAIGAVYSLRNAFVHPNWFTWSIGVISLVTGTMFIVWLSELLTEKGIGNGSSFIIFSNILSSLPRAVNALFRMSIQKVPVGIIISILVIILFIIIIGFVVWLQDGERRLPVQYSKKMVGRQMFGGQSSFIPIKVNIAGVMSIIFAISLLQFPKTVSQFFTLNADHWVSKLIVALEITHPIGAAVYVVLIFCFTFFYTSFAINPVEMAENMKKSGGFIPGIRPGKPTSDYIARTVYRLSWIGAIFYSITAMIPVVLDWSISPFYAGFRIGMSGTTLLIVTGVALDIVKQLESRLLMRHHKGFLN